LLLPAAAEQTSNAEHDDFGNCDALDKQEARSAPKMRSALSALLPQSNGKAPVTILISRRFSSAAAVSRDASHHQAATISHDNDERADRRGAFECTAAGRSPDQYQMSVHDRSTAAPLVQLGCRTMPIC